MKKSKLLKRIIVVFCALAAFFAGYFLTLKLMRLLPQKTKNSKQIKAIPKKKIADENTKNKVLLDSLESAPKNNIEYQALPDGKYRTDNDYILEKTNGIAYIDGQILANKTYSLTPDYKPEVAYIDETKENSEDSMDKTAALAFEKMKADAAKENLDIYVASGHRSYEFQVTIYNHSVEVDGKEHTDAVSSRPGHSEHQTGLCMDINEVTDDFAATREGAWLNENAYKYGFTLRFPSGQEEYTGYNYESWHYRYVGCDLALKLYNNGDWISLEKYYGISSSYE